MMISDHPLHVLIVDDEDIVHTTLGSFISATGHHVYDARDGNQGLAAIETRSYDLALVDVRMPGMDGIELLARARQIRPETSDNYIVMFDEWAS